MIKNGIHKALVIVCAISLLLSISPSVYAAAQLNNAEKPPSVQHDAMRYKTQSDLLSNIDVDFFWRLVQEQLGRKPYPLPYLEDKAVVLLLGQASVGKNAFVNHMLGHALGWQYEDIEKIAKNSPNDSVDKRTRGEKRPIITKKNPHTPIADMSDGATSGTTVPQVYILPPENLVLVDCPLLDDTQGTAQTLLHLLMIRLLVHKAKEVKAIIGMIPYTAFTDESNGAAFVNLVAQLSYLVTLAECLPNIFLGITRCPEWIKREAIVDKITSIAKEKNLRAKHNDAHEMRKGAALVEQWIANKAHILPLSLRAHPSKITKILTNLAMPIDKASFAFRHPTLDVITITQAIFSQPAAMKLINTYRLHKELLCLKVETQQKIAENKAILDDEHQLNHYMYNAVTDKRAQLRQATQAWQHAISQAQGLAYSVEDIALYRTMHIILSAKLIGKSKTITYHDLPFEADALQEIYDPSKVKKRRKNFKPADGIYKAQFTVAGSWDNWRHDSRSNAYVTVKFYVKNDHVQKQLRARKQRETIQKRQTLIQKKADVTLAKEVAAADLKTQTQQLLPQKIKDLDRDISTVASYLNGKEIFITFIGEVYPCLFPEMKDDYFTRFSQAYKHNFKLFGKVDRPSSYDLPSKTYVDRQAYQAVQYKAVAKASLPEGQLLIPANGQCLYTTIIIGYLLPVREAVDEVMARIDQLFGLQPADYLNALDQALKNPIHYLPYLHSNAFGSLVTDFMDRMNIKKGTWGGPQEIQAIANKLKINIQAHYPDPSNPTQLVASDLTKPTEDTSDITLHIVRDKVHPVEVLTQAQKASAKDNPHYQHYRLKYTPFPSSVLRLWLSQQLPLPHTLGPLSQQSHAIDWFTAAEEGNSRWLAALYGYTTLLHDWSPLLMSVKYLRKQCAHLHTKNENHDTALHLSARNGHLASVQWLLQQGSYIHIKNKQGNTALICSAKNGQLACVKYLVQHGADISSRGEEDKTALQWAAAANTAHKTAIVNYLFTATQAPQKWFAAAKAGNRKLLSTLYHNYNIDINKSGESSDTALLWSAYKGRLDCLKWLSQQGVNIHAKNKWKHTALTLSARNGQLACVKYLIQQGANIHDKNEWGNTSLLLSAQQGHVDCLKWLVEQGADIHVSDHNGDTALMWSAYNGHIACVKYLVQQGANITLQGYAQKTALQFAKETGKHDVVQFLSKALAVQQKWFAAVQQQKGDSQLLAVRYDDTYMNVNTRNAHHNTALILSACSGHIDCVQWLCQQRANIHTKNKWKNTALILSARYGHIACLKYLIAQGANIHDKNEYNETALLWSARSGHLACVQWLVEQGADMHASDKNGDNALIWSAYKGHLPCVKYLVQQGADITWKGYRQKTALQFAEEEGKQGVVQFLSKAKEAKQKWFSAVKKEEGNSHLLATLYDEGYINVDIHNVYRNTALLLSACFGHLDCVEWLCQQKANIHAKNKWGNTALVLSARYGHLNCIKYLVERGADLHDKNETGYTALLWSAREGHLDCVKYLVEQGADIHTTNKWGNTALLWSAERGHLGIIKYLLEQGADIYACDTKGITALLLSASKGHLACVKYLVQQGAAIISARDERKTTLQFPEEIGKHDIFTLLSTALYAHTHININTHNTYRNTPLILSACHGRLACVEWLCQQGANINAKNKWENTALILSARYGHLAVVKYLVEQGANIHDTNDYNETALLLSAKKGHLDCIKYLLEYGADMHARDKNGDNALMWSAYQGHLACVKYLVEQGADTTWKGYQQKTALQSAAAASNHDVVHYLSNLATHTPAATPNNAGKATRKLARNI